MKRIFNQTDWPKPNPKLEAAIGRFLIAWNVLEQELDFAIQEACRLDFHAGRSVTANLGTKAKLEMFHSLAFGLRDSLFDPTFIETLDKLVNDTVNASSTLRNFLFHGQPTKVLIDPKAATDFWIKYAARKGGVRGTMVRLSAPYINGNTAHVKELVGRWTAIRRKVRSAIEIMDLVDSETREEIETAFELTPQTRTKLETINREDRRKSRLQGTNRPRPEGAPPSDSLKANRKRSDNPPPSSEG